MKKQIAYRIATCGPVGYAKIGSGTLGSLCALPFLAIGSANSLGFLMLSAALLAAGLWSSCVVSEDLGDSDPSVVIIDEVCGMMISLLFLPLRWPTLVAGFFLFRFFDIVKPFPIRSLERAPKGIGIVLDDVGAGIYTNIILHILIRYAHL